MTTQTSSAPTSKPTYAIDRTSGVDTLRVCGLTLTGVTRGGNETCLMVPELDLMFDVGMCPPGALEYETILVSHGHADHMGGLPYLISQRNLKRLTPPKVHLPLEIIPPFRRVLENWSEIEGFDLTCLVDLRGHSHGTCTMHGRDLTARAVRTSHRVKSIAWVIERTTHRLRSEFVGRASKEIADARKAGEAITTPHIEPILCVTGDTQIECFDQNEVLRRCKVLVHEVTNFDDRRDVELTRQYGHTHLDELAARAEQFTGEALVIVHRSMRYTRAEAEALVKQRFPASVLDRVHVFGN